MLLRLPLEILIILIPILVFSLCFHEFSHGYIAYILGDDTAEKAGRLTLNPMAHLDPIGSVMILFVGFGWAKPVPVNPVNFSNPREDMMKVAFAGPASNLLIAFISGLILRFFIYIQYMDNKILYDALNYIIFINVALAIFNMLPIAPLDGSKIFGYVISKINPQLSINLEIYGPRILMGMIMFGILTGYPILYYIMSPFIKFFIFIFTGI